MPRVILTQAAADDVRRIFADSLRLFGLAQADAYYAGLDSVLVFLSHTPRAARLRTEINPPVRVHPYKSHIIIYECVESDILVLRVRHSHEDWQSGPQDLDLA